MILLWDSSCGSLHKGGRDCIRPELIPKPEQVERISLPRGFERFDYVERTRAANERVRSGYST